MKPCARASGCQFFGDIELTAEQEVAARDCDIAYAAWLSTFPPRGCNGICTEDEPGLRGPAGDRYHAALLTGIIKDAVGWRVGSPAEMEMALATEGFDGSFSWDRFHAAQSELYGPCARKHGSHEGVVE